jgi:hypothetical protein
MKNSTGNFVNRPFIRVDNCEIPRLSAIHMSHWEPFLSDFLMNVADHVSYDNKFYFDGLGYDDDFKRLGFVNFFFNRENSEPENSAVVLKGRVGVGKTSFLEWWQALDDRKKYFAKIDVNHDSLDHIDSGVTYRTLTEKMLRLMAIDLNLKLSYDSEYLKKFSNYCELIKKIHRADDNGNFESGFVNQTEEFLRKFPGLDSSFLLTCIILSANDTFNRPIWLAVDNVDMQEPCMQQKYIRASYSIYEDICNIGSNLDRKPMFHIIVTMRPETCQHWKFYLKSFQDISYPKPDVIKIALKRLSSAFDYQMKRQLPFPGKIEMENGLIFNNTAEFCKFLEKGLEKCIGSSTWPFTPEPKEWHLLLVNRNVRKFIKGWVHFLLSGNFLNIWGFSSKNMNEVNFPSPYRYLRMLIKGKYEEYPGDRIDEAAPEDPNTPLVFNVFGLQRDPAMKKDYFIRHYFIYLRILQYLTSYDKDVKFSDCLSDLSIFFDVNMIEKATQILLWFRIIDEVNIGARNISGVESWRNIKLNADSIIRASKTTYFYLKNLIPEYEYISCMSMVSYQMINTENQDFGHVKRKLKYAQSTLSFLTSYFDILENNLKDYEKKSLLDDFCNFFVSPRHNQRPLLSIISNSIRALQYFSKNDDEFSEILNKLYQLDGKTKESLTHYIKDIYTVY